jgi:chromosome segregation ATPase
MAENAQGYVTKSDLLQTEKEIRRDIGKELRDTNSKVDGLEQLILPWAKSLSNIEKNTERMAMSYEETNKKQDKILDNYHDLNLRMQTVEGETTVKVQKMSNKGKIIVAGITALGAAGGLIGVFGEKLAHLIFGG